MPFHLPHVRPMEKYHRPEHSGGSHPGTDSVGPGATASGHSIIKLYNGANFFDPRSLPLSDYKKIASLVEPFESVIVENHPNLSGERILEFSSMIKPTLEVAMGLESIHPGGLEQLNKKMIPEDFRRAAGFLKEKGIESRAFVLLRPPFLSENEGIYWALETIKYAFDSGYGILHRDPHPGR